MTAPYRRRSRANPVAYWWDYVWVDDKLDSVVVQSDDPRYPEIVSWKLSGREGWKIDNRELFGMPVEVIWASRIIKMLETGQVTAKQVSQAGPDKVNKSSWPN